MKTIRHVSAPGGQIKVCADATAGEVGTKRKASGVDHHPAKHSHGMKFKSSGNRVSDVNHHPAGPSLVTKNEENPQLPPDEGILESAWPPDLLAAIDAAWAFVAHDDTFAIHAPGPVRFATIGRELFDAMDAAQKDFTNKLSGPERIAAIDVSEKDLPNKLPVEWL